MIFLCTHTLEKIATVYQTYMYLCLAWLLLIILCVTYLTVIILRNTSHDSNTVLSYLSYHNCNKTATTSLDGNTQGKVTESVCTIILIWLLTSLPIPSCVACYISFMFLFDCISIVSQCLTFISRRNYYY